eukprot:CAMPEP_0175081722 /NCGR_PEP_ID=MMETSP0052_2-20121109/26322_1 /TAXON_ID=51329 ORGANISM="Polytomella parva, Strain SAG 63-3" /NCGR_SAMPLE_ID=MMETSP0052_2 /ASSEMBLY_ACC=CAM_ASM_000194 /LENGTH=214 /DNA_ID=CAMNT_0016352767 /DNA_START=65 /DNA_END=707 /DNA_ORIENTATION=+
MAEYLTRFVERMSEVPTQLRRRLAFIRSLDERTNKLQILIESECKKLAARIESGETTSELESGGRKRKRSHFDFELATKKLLAISDEKVSVANQVYDFIDKQVMSLDEDLYEIEELIAQESRMIPKAKLAEMKTHRGGRPRRMGKGLRRRRAVSARSRVASSSSLDEEEEEEEDEDDEAGDDDDANDSKDSMDDSRHVSEPDTAFAISRLMDRW